MPADLKQSGSLSPRVLASGQITAATSDTTVYTVPAASGVRVATFALHNTSSGIVNVWVSIVPSGGTVDGTHRMLTSYPLGAKDTAATGDVLSFLAGAYLDTGASISINVDTGNAVNYLLTGVVAA